MMSYTPGPWEVVVNDDDSTFIIPKPDEKGFPYLSVCALNVWEQEGIRRANARLIAKAPQMYSALLKIAVLSDPLITDEDTFSVQLDVINELAEEVKALVEEQG